MNKDTSQTSKLNKRCAEQIESRYIISIIARYVGNELNETLLFDFKNLNILTPKLKQYNIKKGFRISNWNGKWIAICIISNLFHHLVWIMIDPVELKFKLCTKDLCKTEEFEEKFIAKKGIERWFHPLLFMKIKEGDPFILKLDICSGHYYHTMKLSIIVCTCNIKASAYFTIYGSIFRHCKLTYKSWGEYVVNDLAMSIDCDNNYFSNSYYKKKEKKGETEEQHCNLTVIH